MVDVALVILAIFVIFSIVLIFKIIKNVMKAVLLVIFFLVVMVVAATLLVIFDIRDFSSEFNEETSLFLLTHGDFAMAGVEARGSTTTMVEHIDLERHQRFLGPRDRSILRDDYYKVVLVKRQALLDLEGFEEEKQALESTSLSERTDAFATLTLDGLLGNPFTAMRAFRNGDIVVYPESPAFKAVKILPLGFTVDVIGKVTGPNEN